MHIVVLVQDFLPETGAGPARISELAAEWIAAGHEVSVVTGFPSRRLAGMRDGEVPATYRGRLTMRETLNGVQVYRSWLFTSRRRGFALTLVNHLTFALSSFLHGLVRLPRPDVVIASGPPYFAFFSGVGVAALRGAPLVLDIRDLWPDYLAEMDVIRAGMLRRMMFASERWLLARAKSVVVVTESFRERLIEKRVPRDKIAVIPNGVDVSRYFAGREPAPLPSMSARENEVVVGYLGTFGAGQGLQAVVEAARLLRTRRRDVRFVLVGDGPERGRIEAMLAATPVEGVSLHSPIPRDQTRAFYNSCDVVVVPHAALPVLGGTIPSKIFEVLACERPLVAALKGEGARIVEASEGGVLATPGDASSIATAIETILGLSPEARVQMGQRGRAYVLANYNRSVLAERYRALLEQVRRVT